MRGWYVPAAFVAAVGVGVALKRRRRALFPDQRRELVSSLDALTPATSDAVRATLKRMRSLGWDPVVHETYRAPGRADELASKGTGIRRSMHTLGLAADIIDRTRGWGAPPEFWRALAESAEAEGLVSGYRWDGADHDPAHVQSVAVGSQPAAWQATDPDAIARRELARRRGDA